MTDSGTGGDDPFAEAFGAEKNVPRGNVAVTFNRSSGEMMVYGGLFFGLFILLGAFMTGLMGMWAVALTMLGTSFYFYPMVRTDRAQMRMEPRGLFLDGLGWVPWTAVKDVKIVNRSVRTIRNAHLEIELTAPVSDVVTDRETGGNLIRALMVRIWSTETSADGVKNGRLRARLEGLRATPEMILAAIQRHIGD